MKSRIKSLEATINALRSIQLIQDRDPDISSQKFAVYSPQLQSFLSVPAAASTQKAIDRFFRFSDKLFNFFSPIQASAWFRSVFREGKMFDRETKADVCCLMAIATTGCQYLEHEGERHSEERFYDLTKQYLDHLIEIRPLDAIKVCSLLGTYNISEKNTTALAYLGMRLSIALLTPRVNI